MKLHRTLSFCLMTAGAVASAKAIFKRTQWEEVNVHLAIMLDWDDVQAVATRAPTTSHNRSQESIEDLLHRYKETGATHLSIPELTLGYLMGKGELSVTQGASPKRVFLRTQDATLAELVTTELQARLPHLETRRSQAKNPLISFRGDLPTVAEVGLGFNPAHAELAHRAGLSPVARPVGYSWVQPEMIDRTLDQAAELGVNIVAVQGNLIPGHEFNIQTTVEAMRRNRLHYAYFRESRHQKGDWFLAKNLARQGLVILAHEFELPELLEEDWFTLSHRWANLAVEAGVRLCSVRFFRILHAADPLESLDYVRELTRALAETGLLVDGHPGTVDLSTFLPQRDTTTLAWAGLSAAGATGLASDLLPLPDQVKLLGVGAAALALTGLPFLEQVDARQTPGHHHHHDHHQDHDHHNNGHNHDRTSVTAYAPKGLSLVTAVAYPTAALAVKTSGPLTALIQGLGLSLAGATTLSATTAETDYLLGIEEYRGYNLDWLFPIGLAVSTAWTSKRRDWWGWVPLAGVALAALRSFSGGLVQDLPAAFDREHRHAHTHHLSAFQRAVGDSKLALSLQPLRIWSLLAPLGAVGTAILLQRRHKALATAALTATAAGQVASLTGFRNGQRPLLKTLAGRAKGWAIGAMLAGIVWFAAWLFSKKW